MNAVLLHKNPLFLMKYISLFIDLQALITGLKAPGSNSLTLINKTELHRTVSGLPHSHHSYPQRGLNSNIQHLCKKENSEKLHEGCMEKEIIQVAPGALSHFL